MHNKKLNHSLKSSNYCLTRPLSNKFSIQNSTIFCFDTNKNQLSCFLLRTLKQYDVEVIDLFSDLPELKTIKYIYTYKNFIVENQYLYFKNPKETIEHILQFLNLEEVIDKKAAIKSFSDYQKLLNLYNTYSNNRKNLLTPKE